MAGGFSVLGYHFSLHLSTSRYSHNINTSANIHVMGRYRLRLLCHLFVTRPPRGRLTVVLIVSVTAQIHQGVKLKSDLALLAPTRELNSQKF